MDYPSVEAGLRASGLMARGGFHPGAGDGVPPLADGRPARTLVPVGNAGPQMWRAFTAAPEADAAADPLNRWSRRVLDELAARWGARALFPFGGPPYLPFVAWAKRAEAVAESPLGMLIHPDYGLWHAYRGALAFAEVLDLPPRDQRPRPCDTCADRPCLSACPVGAFTGDGYDVAACVNHISALEGADCVDLGCRARRACPVGRGYRYEPARARFHMAAFLRAQQRDPVAP
ncbi:MAG: ferredoxin [Kiloniellaceae bacterium]